MQSLVELVGRGVHDDAPATQLKASNGAFKHGKATETGTKPAMAIMTRLRHMKGTQQPSSMMAAGVSGFEVSILGLLRFRRFAEWASAVRTHPLIPNNTGFETGSG